MADERVRVWAVDDQPVSAGLPPPPWLPPTISSWPANTRLVNPRSNVFRTVVLGSLMIFTCREWVSSHTAIRAAHPDLMVLLMSTYAVEDSPAGAADCGAAACRHKGNLSSDLLIQLWRAAN
jgi:hypothetical protein